MYENPMTVLQRISILEETVARDRRQISVASLEFLIVMTCGDPDQCADVKTRLLVLGVIVDGALDELERLYEELGDAQESR